MTKYKYISFICTLVALLCFSSVTVAEEEAMWRYTVRPGDNLITLGKMHLLNPDDWKTLQKLNQVKNPYRMPVGQVLRIPLSLVKQGPASAEVIFVSGDATWQQSATNFEPLKAGQQLGAGAKIFTKDNSKVVLKFADGTTTDVGSNAILSLDALSLYSGGAMVDTKLRLQKGGVKTHANPEHVKGNGMHIITPSAIAAVRGTEFRVTADDKSTTQETLDGQVAFDASNNTVLVDKGYGSQAANGKPPIAPVPLLPAVNTDGLKTYYDALPVKFDMPAMAGATSFVAKVATDDQFNHLVGETEVAAGQQLAFNQVPDGQLFLNVRARDQQGIAGYEAVHTFELNARPFQPDLVYPEVQGVVRDPLPELQWLQADGASQYEVEIASDQAFKQIHETQRVAGISYRLNKALAAGDYFWRVTSIEKTANGVEMGPIADARQFTYKPKLKQPDISQLEVKVANNRVYVKTISPPEGLTYHVSLDNPFNHQINVWEGERVDNTFMFMLKEYGKQVLHVRYVDSHGEVGPAASYEFEAYSEYAF